MDSFKQYIPWMVAFVLAVSIVGGYRALFAAPASFSPGSIVRIAPGTSAPEIAKELADAHIIAHPILLRALLRVIGESNNIQTGVYKFENPQNLFVVAYRLIMGEYGLPAVRITFVEGVTVREMALQVAESFPDITVEDFTTAAKPQEGYLFPDTYFFQPEVDAKGIVAALRANFDTKIAPLQIEISASGRSLSDTLVLASLVEKEARTSVNRRIVAGIFLNRLQIGMPLQVDAVFGYIFNRATYSPSSSDLKVNSPYNTYTHAGLPPGPIDNPGLDALDAVVQPTKTNYLYYLTGNDDQMHYATTYAAHQANQKKYLP